MAWCHPSGSSSVVSESQNMISLLLARSRSFVTLSVRPSAHVCGAAVHGASASANLARRSFSFFSSSSSSPSTRRPLLLSWTTFPLHLAEAISATPRDFWPGASLARLQLNLLKMVPLCQTPDKRSLFYLLQLCLPSRLRLLG